MQYNNALTIVVCLLIGIFLPKIISRIANTIRYRKPQSWRLDALDERLDDHWRAIDDLRIKYNKLSKKKKKTSTPKD